MYAFLDYLFVAFHTGLISFNATGWIWRRTRRWHLLCIVATWASWLGLGLVYGLGYCPCTDWHWQVKRALGETELPSSYIKYYFDKLTGQEWNAATVDTGVMLAGLVVLVLSIWLNYRDRAVKNHR